MTSFTSLTKQLGAAVSKKVEGAISEVSGRLKAPGAEGPRIPSDSFERSTKVDWTESISSGAGRGAEPRQAVTAGARLDSPPRGLEPSYGGRRVYEREGDQKLNLRSPEEARKLIAASPQLDDLDRTKLDSVRCGGAAMMNGLLLDGDPRKSATAIEKTAKDSGVTLSSEERSALISMKRGSMTPREAATTQELLVKLGTVGGANMPGGHVRYTNAGLTPVGMAELAGKLRKNGGFSNAKSVGFHSERQADGSNHWTVTVKNASGETHRANSWPGPDGHASVTSAHGTSRRELEGAPNPAYRGEVILENEPDGRVRYEVTGRFGGPGGYEKYSRTADSNEAPKFDSFSRSVHGASP
ncbi:MAG: hypothetical protein HYV07_30585 [Deltaproteobacteria bacterium]|nr:hypothetical protein [Deltaproteobacteria bacterium]